MRDRWWWCLEKRQAFLSHVVFPSENRFPGESDRGRRRGGGGFSASSLLFGKLSGIFSNFFCLFRLRFSHLLFRLRKCFFFFE